MAKFPVRPQFSRLYRLLLNPWTVLAGVLLGFYLGIYQPKLVPFVAPLGMIFINALKMCVLPILVSAVAASMARLINSNVGQGFIGRMLVIFVLVMFGVTLFGMVVGMTAKPGANLGAVGLSIMGSHVSASKYAPDIEVNIIDVQKRQKSKLTTKELVNTLIPKNIFDSLGHGRNLQVLFFAILMGIAIGFIPAKSSRTMTEFLESVYLVFAKLVGGLRYLLPFGLCGLIALQFSTTKTEILLAMSKFLAIIFLPFIILLGVGIVILKWRSRRSVVEVIQALKDPLVISLGSAASLPAIPSALTAMTDDLDFPRDKVDLLVPLGITACRFGNMIYFAVATLFVAQLYQIPVSSTELIVVLLGSVLAGLATAGTSGIMTLVMLGLVLSPLGLPLDGVLPLLIVIDPLIGPLRALTNVQLNLAVAALMVEKR